MTTTVTIYSDIHCPWATVAAHRLRQARDKHGLDVVFDHRPWPLEWVNEKGTPRHIVEPESAVLANYEPELFGRFEGQSWPSTFLPAFELVAAARRLGGLRTAAGVDYHLRQPVLRECADDRQAHAQAQAVVDAGADAEAVMRIWEQEPVRADVAADWERSQQLPIQGSPQVFWPDGSTTHNPGMTDHEWVRGIPRVGVTDPDACERLLLEHC
jgi:predicted DsbA family dithiol-disulfide isomerase